MDNETYWMTSIASLVYLSNLTYLLLASWIDRRKTHFFRHSFILAAFLRVFIKFCHWVLINVKRQQFSAPIIDASETTLEVAKTANHIEAI